MYSGKPVCRARAAALIMLRQLRGRFLFALRQKMMMHMMVSVIMIVDVSDGMLSML